MDLIHLGHTFWSLSVLKDLTQVSLTSIKLAVIYLAFVTGKFSDDCSRWFLLFELIFTIFYVKSSEEMICFFFRHGRGPSPTIAFAGSKLIGGEVCSPIKALHVFLAHA